jgi:hypothetical protein
MQVTLPVDKFNEALRDGSVDQKMRRILEDAKPEAAYFCAQNGKRGGFIIVDLKDTSEIPRYAEPWFLSFDAQVEFLPTMTPQDLARAGLGDLAKKWG